MGYFSSSVAPSLTGMGNLGSGTGYNGKGGIGGVGVASGLKGAGGTFSDWIKGGGSSPGSTAQHTLSYNAGGLADATKPINDAMNQGDTDYKNAYDKYSQNYLSTAGNLVNGYTSKINDLSNQSKSQATDASKTYTNSILPEMKNALGMAKTNASQAMTLAQASDPNNPIMKQIRDLYNQQGQQAITQGKQDFGVLSALGAQAAGSQFGAAGPMTSGMQGQIYAANQAQAGNAYSAAQKRMTDLQNQGLNKSFDQSNQLYQFGQNAQHDYGQSIQNLQNSQDQFYGQQGAFRQEQGGYAGDKLGANQGLNADQFNTQMTGAGIDRGNVYGAQGREQDRINQYYGVQNQGALANLQSNTAQNGANGNILGSVIGAAGTVGGGYLAGGGGAAAAASDKRMKKNINDVSNSDIDEFLKAVKPKSFEYKDNSEPGTTPGKRVGFMMQDVQGTKLGDKMTRRGPDGQLMYDKENLNGILLAALSRHAKSAA